MSKKVLFVGGTFDDEGKSSSIIRQIYQGFTSLSDKQHVTSTLINGGNIECLKMLIEMIKTQNFDYIVWMPNVDNKYPKYVKEIKQYSPKSILITSKRTVEKQYSLVDVIQHALEVKSNLVVQFSSKSINNYSASIIDPLGNMYCENIEDFEKVGQILFTRANFLSSMTRISSTQVGIQIEIPDNQDFFNIVKKYADVFDALIPKPSENKRFFGNASFRCTSGFPSFRVGDKIFVSKRNVDKHLIQKDNFVAVNADKLPVEYYGEHKPSVDTPIQIELYQYYKNINYIVHGHVYIKDAMYTSLIPIPCGAYEEAGEIMDVLDDLEEKFELNNASRDIKFFSVNLKGHGCIIGASDLSYFKNIEFFARPFPEKFILPA